MVQSMTEIWSVKQIRVFQTKVYIHGLVCDNTQQDIQGLLLQALGF
jgi:hypothetical protein